MEKHVYPDNLDKPAAYNYLCSVLPSKSKIHTLRLAHHSGKKYITLLVQCPQPGKPDAAQLPWEGRALCPWPKCAKANRGGSAAALLLQAACVTPAGWEAKVALLKVGFSILEKILSSGFLAEEKWGHPALPPISPGGMCCPAPAKEHRLGCAAVLHCLCSREQQILSGVSLQWATGSRSPLPHQQPFKLQ